MALHGQRSTKLLPDALAFYRCAPYFRGMQLENDPHQTQLRKILPAVIWTGMQESHQQRLKSLIEPYLEKRSRRARDPVLDFLFEYYTFRPTHLYRWSPGIGVGLECNDSNQLPGIRELTLHEGVAWLDRDEFPVKRARSFRWILEVLHNSTKRRPLFGCFEIGRAHV